MENDEILKVFEVNLEEIAQKKKYRTGLSFEDRRAVAATFKEILNHDLNDGTSILTHLKGGV